MWPCHCHCHGSSPPSVPPTAPQPASPLKCRKNCYTMGSTAPASLPSPLSQPWLPPTLLYSDVSISVPLENPFLPTISAGGSAHFHPPPQPHAWLGMGTRPTASNERWPWDCGLRVGRPGLLNWKNVGCSCQLCLCCHLERSRLRMKPTQRWREKPYSGHVLVQLDPALPDVSLL